jgi:hypothetical protein
VEEPIEVVPGAGKGIIRRGPPAADRGELHVECRDGLIGVIPLEESDDERVGADPRERVVLLDPRLYRTEPRIPQPEHALPQEQNEDRPLVVDHPAPLENLTPFLYKSLPLFGGDLARRSPPSRHS